MTLKKHYELTKGMKLIREAKITKLIRDTETINFSSVNQFFNHFPPFGEKIFDFYVFCLKSGSLQLPNEAIHLAGGPTKILSNISCFITNFFNFSQKPKRLEFFLATYKSFSQSEDFDSGIDSNLRPYGGLNGIDISSWDKYLNNSRFTGTCLFSYCCWFHSGNPNVCPISIS